MKPIFFLLFMFFSKSIYSQEKPVNYIAYYNCASEAVYYFYEMQYDSSLVYFEEAFQHVKERKPVHQYYYCRVLWETGKTAAAIAELNMTASVTRFLNDTTYFTGISANTKALLIERMKQNELNLSRATKHDVFVREMRELDQAQRQMVSHTTVGPDTIIHNQIKAQDRKNEKMVLDYIKQNGFPAGINGGWNQSFSTILLHFSREWFVDNYKILLSEVRKGNLEPWMLSRAMDRNLVSDSCKQVSPYDSYFGKGGIDPFLMFKNRIEIGLSPYYDLDWRIYSKGTQPKPTNFYEEFKAKKEVYNCVRFLQ